MNRYNIILNDSSFDDLNDIFDFCKNKYGFLYASKVIRKILSSIYSLSIFPNSNSIFAVSNNTIIRKHIINKRYIILFKVIQNSVYIYNILDGRKNLSPTNYLK